MSDTKALKTLRFGKNVFAGVAAGMAYATGINVFIVRILWLLSFVAFTPATPILAYVLFAWLLPEWDAIPEDYSERAESDI